MEDINPEEIGIDKNKEFEKITINNVTQTDIVEAIKSCLKISSLISPSQSLVNSVYSILKALFLDNKKYVILEAPTGSGKTIIGFMTYFCIQYLFRKKMYEDDVIDVRHEPVKGLAYSLTSAKMLQEQIDKDLDRFDFRDYIVMLKGVANYDCISETEKLKEPFEIGKDNKPITRVSYADRPCKGMPKKDREVRFSECDFRCPYQLARYEASEKACTVLNYAYFLNVMRAEFKPFFNERLITFADEAHLVPEIVCQIFNFEFNQYLLNQLIKLVQEIEMNLGSNGLEELKEIIMKSFKYFKEPLNRVSTIIEYFNNIALCRPIISHLIKNPGFIQYDIQLNKNLERVDELLMGYNDFKNLIENRPIDVYFESLVVAEDKTTNSKVYKHIVRDLDESELVRKNFLSKLNKCVFMSATLGDMDEYATMMGMEKDEYVALRLPSSFDYSKSPIYMCKSTFLNYANFEKNIDKAIMDTLKICNEMHSKEKGIIHTSTFKICNLIKDKINMGLVPDRNRFLFYQNAEEKQKMVELMKQSSKPYVIIGPSLYEGLDLKDAEGRFNILLKVPYSGIDDYVRQKMNRFPFWYNRVTLEKITQAIGRTNRHTNDYSTVYLIDACFDKVINSCNESIRSRIQYKTIY
jgi:Rad3-related DNA helicase